MQFEQYTARKQREFGEQFDASALAPQFIRYFNSGERVRVEIRNDGERAGTIGVTTGWRPAFLLMHNTRSTGSSDVLGFSDTVTAVKVGARYQPVS